MVTVRHTAADLAAFDRTVTTLVEERVASRLAAQDATLWGEDARAEAEIRLSWTRLAESSRPLVDEIEQLRAELSRKGLDHVVLCGMGGSSLAPEVICAAAAVELTVLDSSQPDMVRTALTDRLERSIVVVSSKSGGTIETDSQRRAYERAFTEAGLDPADHLVVVTDPGSPLDEQASAAGYRVFRADPHVGGRYSALTAFGLVPSGLAGAPIGTLLDEAHDAQGALASDSPDNPALLLGALIGTAHDAEADKLVIADRNGHGLGNWIEQLVAESTGKDRTGVLPVVVPSENATNFSPSTSDSVLVAIGADAPPAATSGFAAAVEGPLGAQLLLWESAIAVAGRLLGINPFDQPDVESAKQAARDLLDGGGQRPEPTFTDGGVDVFADGGSTLAEAVELLLAQLDPRHGYVAVQAYLDRLAYAELVGVRELLAERTGRPVTFGWGPRFLHSTGQYHKGGAPNGVFLQITGQPAHDLDVPGRDFTFGGFIASQAAGDAGVLRSHGRPVVTLHLRDVAASLPRIREVLA